ncbi:MAG: 50S ribosomal protein L24 [Nitrososphaeraceae archaeon]|nr:50S ribosomal protein L24 [Nitrososphaeraceae archaeon]MDW0136607.1 50S ribosomal protein L24 [Nitrososphaeraceae archaeon]MDW0138194.1 50S ribosomal protein L24 [Nitrososphaeraceae archaeon]MDW0141782.1 50S ribosomal protein L24 [Nitrososphaeraceae archaeon]MDW0144493.1 50S ribosomal protein L24 [Nitrososphaeraceae archaeon]
MFYKLISKHKRDKFLGANLSENLREQHSKRSMRVIKGDTVRILRGEYVGIEGKVEKVNTEKSTLSIEGVQREKIRGGNVKVQVHASNVQIISLNTDDDYRIKGIPKSKDKNTNIKKGKDTKKSAVKKESVGEES